MKSASIQPRTSSSKFYSIIFNNIHSCPYGGLCRECAVVVEAQLLSFAHVRHVVEATLVERFDIEPFSDFSAKWANVIRLVLFCIDAKFCKKIFIGKLLTRSTRFTCFCTAQTSIFQKLFVKFFRIFWQNLQKIVIFEFFSLILLRC